MESNAVGPATSGEASCKGLAGVCLLAEAVFGLASRPKFADEARTGAGEL